MIKSIKIQNIQSHTNSELEFCDGVNMIIGNSDTGKSAILNSIFWCMFNRPLGDPHRNWNGGEMVSCIELDNGTVQISRDKQTKYKVTQETQGKQGKEGKSFKASGTTPPEEVTNLFNMDRKINVQRQLERDAPIFLISETPGEVASFLNKVGGLYKIDETVSKGKSDLRKTQSDLNTTKELIKEKQKELENYVGIDELYAKVLTYDETAQKQAKKGLILDKIESLLVDSTKIENKIDELKQKTQIKQKVNQALTWLTFISQNNKTMESFVQIIRQIDIKEQKQKELKVSTSIKQKVQKGFDLLNTIKEIKNKHKVIYKKNNKIKEYEDVKESLNIKTEEKKKQFHKLMPAQCPLCGGTI